jgi:ribosomal protein L32
MVLRGRNDTIVNVQTHHQIRVTPTIGAMFFVHPHHQYHDNSTSQSICNPPHRDSPVDQLPSRPTHSITTTMLLDAYSKPSTTHLAIPSRRDSNKAPTAITAPPHLTTCYRCATRDARHTVSIECEQSPFHIPSNVPRSFSKQIPWFGGAGV